MTITAKELALTNTLQMTTEALTLVAAERDALARTKLSDQAAYVALRAERDALRADAERYRWLRADPLFLGHGVEMTTAQIDEKIDAAMKGKS